jgi:uncharacterized protein
MKKLIILMFLIITYNTLSALVDSSSHELIFKSKAFVNLMTENEFEQAFEYFDDNMKNALPLENFEKTWYSIINQMGELQEIVKADIKPLEDKKFVVLTGKFENMYLDLRLIYDSTGKMAGFFIAPNNDYKVYKTPGYVDINTFEEHELTFGTKGMELKSILTLPKKENHKKSLPVVILVHGSGPNDMDESIGPNKPFKDLAWGLATKGIAVFRYNKRTYEKPEDFINKIDDLTVWDETINDVLQATGKMKNIPDINPKMIYILGHSLGGLVAPRIGEKEKNLAGLILMAAPAQPFHKIIIPQYEYLFNLDEQVTTEEQEKLDSMKIKISRIENPGLSVETPMKLLPFESPASYWLDLRNYYPVKKAKELKCRILILQGERDYQVPKSEFEIWQKEFANEKRVNLKLYPKLNHLFMEGKGKSNPEEYMHESHIPEYVIDDIVEFILQDISRK